MTQQPEPLEGAPLIAPSSTDHPLYDQIGEACRSVYDPEIPVNIYDLGLIYTIEIDAQNAVQIVMTLTAPGCPVAGDMPGWVAEAVEPLALVVQSVGEITQLLMNFALEILEPGCCCNAFCSSGADP